MDYTHHTNCNGNSKLHKKCKTRDNFQLYQSLWMTNAIIISIINLTRPYMKIQKDLLGSILSRSGTAGNALLYGQQVLIAGQGPAAVRVRLGQVSSDVAVGLWANGTAPVESSQKEELLFLCNQFKTWISPHT